jgi:hypothetical protein
MSVWLQLAQMPEGNIEFPSNNHHKPSKSHKSLILRNESDGEANHHKPSKTIQKGEVGLYDGNDPSKSNPIKQGVSDFMMVNDGFDNSTQAIENQSKKDFMMVYDGKFSKSHQKDTGGNAAPITYTERQGHDMANLILDEMREAKTADAMRKVGQRYQRELKAIRAAVPVRILHMQNLVSITERTGPTLGNSDV